MTQPEAASTSVRVALTEKKRAGSPRMVRFLLVFHFILACVRFRVRPYRFFQLNGRYFNESKGLFSKLEMDALIPERWRLKQQLDDGEILPAAYPVFVKPEWGQNSHGIVRVDNPDELAKVRQRTRLQKTGFLLQEAASGQREFELFYIRSEEEFDQPAVLSITETLHRGDDPYPVNSILNPSSVYRECTEQFSNEQQLRLWDYLASMGRFRIARVGVRADSPDELLAGNFKVIEINVFLPMPLLLMDEDISRYQKHRFILRSMNAAAKMVRTIPPDQKMKWIFFRKLRAHYQVKACEQ